MTEYRWADAADYENIIEMANLAFDPAHFTGNRQKDTSPESYFPRILPKLYQNPDTAPMHFLALEDGKPVGIVGSFQVPSVVAGERLKVIGIGTVSTHPAHRREGHMLKMMEESIRRAAEEGADYLVLGGQRQRYEHWGFAPAETEISYDFDGASFRHLFGAEYRAGFEIRPLQETDTEYIRRERALRTGAGVWQERPEKNEYKALFSMGSRPYVILKEGSFRGTVMMDEESALSDLRPAAPEEVLQILNDIWYRFYENSGVAVMKLRRVPPDAAVMHRILSRTASATCLTDGEMIRVLNWAHTLKAWMKYTASCRPMADGCLTVRFPDGEKLKLSVTNGIPSVLEYGGTAEIETDDERECVNFFFGNASRVSDPGFGLRPEVRSWFPLYFHMPLSDET